MYKLKKELGSNAVVLNTRKIKRKGLLGFLKKPLIEVVAAIEDNDVQREKNRTSDDINKTSHFEEEFQNQLFINKKNDISQDLNNEIKKLQTMMEDVSRKVSNPKIKNLPINLLKYKEKFIENGIDENIAVDILYEITEREVVENIEDTQINNIIEKSIYNLLGDPSPIKLNGKQKVVFFIGPTGVGKTTTLAKIAASYVLEDKNKVGFITADTYRIAAVEQLKIYSEILKIPIKIIYETKEIKGALSNLEDKELILVDTAGRSHKNIEQLNELKELIESVDNKETFLVLSSNTDWQTIKSIIERYKDITDFKIIFTKLDESENFGTIFNTKYYVKEPLSYFTSGQGVPEDIEIVNIKKLSKKLIGE